MGLSEVLGLAGAEAGAKKLSTGERLDLHDEILGRILDQLNKLPEGLRQSLADHLWAEAAATFFEHGYTASAQSVQTDVQVAGNVRRVEAIYTLAPTGGNATLQIGNSLTIPVPGGAWISPGPLTIPLQDGERATLTTAQGAGAMFVGLFGHILPRWGELT